MKIKVESEKIIKAFRKLSGVEVVLEGSADAREAINLVLARSELGRNEGYSKLKEIVVTSVQEYKTSAVDYRMAFLLEFVFQQDTAPELKVELIRQIQDFFHKV